ncbi:hypothetical protein KY341_01325 [Candidatus Woesearchaeota archaeon]|nr:hypothetical protein [Candidatus Woesearchaeota archaeon]
MKKTCFVMVLLFFFIPILISATDWYVRPAGQGPYGVEDGSNYENAWDGLHSVVWGTGGVEPGDNLYVCGLHLYNMTVRSSLVVRGDIYPISGRSEQERVTIRGDCPNDPGVVWSAYIPSYEPWVDEGGGVWSIMLPGDTHRGNIFEDIGVPNVDSYTHLKKVDSLDECNQTPGSHYSIDYEGKSRIYVHTSDSGDPTGRVALNRWGYEFYIRDNSSYITFLNLKMFAPWRYEYRGRPNVTHIRWQNCTLHHGESRIITLGDGNDYMEVLGCDIGYAGTPIYCISSTPLSASYYRFAGNTIHHCGYFDYHQGMDTHAFGIQGGTGGIVEDNYIYNCGDGIAFYLYPGMIGRNITVRRNYIKDLWRTGYMPTAISFGCNAKGALGDTSGNKIYQNIVVNATRAFYYKWSEPVEIYNNVMFNSEYAFRFAGNNESGTKAHLKNNIAYNISDYFIYYGGSLPDTYYLDSDNNIFYSDSGARFYYRDSAKLVDVQTLEEWKAVSDPISTFDPHSVFADPLFVNPANNDFHLKPGSPAIDMGIDVGLTSDFEDTPIPQGTRPDIGAFEYIIGTGCGVADLNCDGSVDIFDLIIVASNFGRTTGFDGRADTDGSNEIDIYDLVFISTRFS